MSSDPASAGLSEIASAIKFWTRQTLALPDDQIVSVSEFDCTKPTCPNKRTVIMVMGQDGSQRKMSLHKSIADVSEFDVLDACLDLLRESPA